MVKNITVSQETRRISHGIKFGPLATLETLSSQATVYQFSGTAQSRMNKVNGTTPIQSLTGSIIASSVS
jgi:hypothetical protein